MSNNSPSDELNRSIPELNIVQSELTVKCGEEELEKQIAGELDLPEGKTIAQLLYEQKENETNH